MIAAKIAAMPCLRCQYPDFLAHNVEECTHVKNRHDDGSDGVENCHDRAPDGGEDRLDLCSLLVPRAIVWRVSRANVRMILLHPSWAVLTRL